MVTNEGKRPHEGLPADPRCAAAPPGRVVGRARQASEPMCFSTRPLLRLERRGTLLIPPGSASPCASCRTAGSRSRGSGRRSKTWCCGCAPCSASRRAAAVAAAAAARAGAHPPSKPDRQTREPAVKSQALHGTRELDFSLFFSFLLERSEGGACLYCGHGPRPAAPPPLCPTRPDFGNKQQATLRRFQILSMLPAVPHARAAQWW